MALFAALKGAVAARGCTTQCPVQMSGHTVEITGGITGQGWGDTNPKTGLWGVIISICVECWPLIGEPEYPGGPGLGTESTGLFDSPNPELTEDDPIPVWHVVDQPKCDEDERWKTALTICAYVEGAHGTTQEKLQEVGEETVRIVFEGDGKSKGLRNKVNCEPAGCSIEWRKKPKPTLERRISVPRGTGVPTGPTLVLCQEYEARCIKATAECRRRPSGTCEPGGPRDREWVTLMSGATPTPHNLGRELGSTETGQAGFASAVSGERLPFDAQGAYRTATDLGGSAAPALGRPIPNIAR